MQGGLFFAVESAGDHAMDDGVPADGERAVKVSSFFDAQSSPGVDAPRHVGIHDYVFKRNGLPAVGALAFFRIMSAFMGVAAHMAEDSLCGQGGNWLHETESFGLSTAGAKQPTES